MVLGSKAYIMPRLHPESSEHWFPEATLSQLSSLCFSLCLSRYSILRLMIEQRLEEISEGPARL